MAKTGIPVPAVIPEGSKAFTICVPDDPFFYGVVMGVLKITTFRYYWQGTDEQIDAVTERMKRMYYEYQDGGACMDCEQITDCIENDETTREALANWFVAEAASNSAIQQAINDAYNPIAPGQNMPDSVTGQALNPDNPTCDKDLLYGQIDTLIEHMNANNIDAQQIVESFSNVAERTSELIGAVPGLGVLPIDEIVDYAQNLWSDDLFEAYEATDTEGYRNTLKCDLFCRAQDAGCNITLQMAFEYFMDRLGATPTDTVSDIIAYLLLGTWSGTEVNDLFYAAQLLFMKYGNEFFGMTGISPFQIYLKLADPNNDWEALCADCPDTWGYEWDTTAGEQFDFHDSGTYGILGLTKISGGGPDYMVAGLSNNPSDPRNSLPAGVHISRVEADIYCESPGSPGTWQSALGTPAGAMFIDTVGGNQTLGFDISDTVSSSSISVVAAMVGTVGQSIIIYKYRVYGPGTLPAGFANGHPIV